MQCLLILILILIIIVLLLLYNYWRISRRESFVSNDSDAIPELAHANINDPYIMPKHFEQFITLEHCDELIRASNNKLFDSETVGGKDKNIRDSQQFWVSKYDPLAKPIFEKASNMFNIPFENGEDLQIVRYQPGQFFSEHHDSCCDHNDKCLDFTKRGGQRILTVLIYLNDNFDGGHTHFKNLNKKYKINKGDALIFHPLATNTSKCHPYALHAGMPVTGGEKWIANLWFREKKFI